MASLRRRDGVGGANGPSAAPAEMGQCHQIVNLADELSADLQIHQGRIDQRPTSDPQIGHHTARGGQSPASRAWSSRRLTERHGLSSTDYLPGAGVSAQQHVRLGCVDTRCNLRCSRRFCVQHRTLYARGPLQPHRLGSGASPDRGLESGCGRLSTSRRARIARLRDAISVVQIPMGQEHQSRSLRR